MSAVGGQAGEMPESGKNLKPENGFKNAQSPTCRMDALLASMVLSRTTAKELDRFDDEIVVEIKSNSCVVVSNKIIPA